MLNNENYGYLVHPLSQFMDDNLKPLTSAYLKVFYAGTSSSAYTYSDWEGTLNTSNIMLSMNGSANVIAEKGKAYKVMLCDALHPPSSPIWVKDNLYVISSEIEIGVISSTQIKDNAYDSVANPTHPDNITDINELTFFRNQDSGANYPILSSEERTYGILIPAPQLEADQGKVPVYKVGDKIGWEYVPTQDSVTAIQAVIPATASSTNQLADKAYVDFGMEQNTAKYLTADALGNPFTGSVPDADDTYFYAGATTLPTKNDYLIVNGDTAHDGVVTRYYFAQDGEVGQWQFQYVVNNSPLNASQLDAINSGWTATKTSEHDSDHTTLSTHVGDSTGNPHGVTKAQVGLGNVENYKAVSVVASQGLTDAEKVAARGNIDAAKDLVSLTITPVIVGTTATLTIEQGSFASIDLTSETALTAVAVVLSNASGVAFPVWWFKIKAGSDITLSVEIGAVAVGWLGATITSITSGKTVEINVVDNVACGGELV